MKVDSLDRSIKETSNALERADKLLERAQALEDKQKSVEQNELNIFQANYQAAVEHLVYMDRKIKPVLLFKTSTEFFELPAETTNPMDYPGHDDRCQKFHDHVEKNKKGVALALFATMVDHSGTAASSVPLGGPMTVLFFSGLESFIDSFSKIKKSSGMKVKKCSS